MAISFAPHLDRHKSTAPVEKPQQDPLLMTYADSRPLPEGVTEDLTGKLTYRPAVLKFPNERSHRAAARIVRAVEGQDNRIYQQMARQITEPGQEVMDSGFLPSGTTVNDFRNPDYDSRRYDLEYARQIRRNIGEVAVYHMIPELRPDTISAEVAEEAFMLNMTAPGLNEPPLQLSITRVLPPLEVAQVAPIPAGNNTDTLAA